MSQEEDDESEIGSVDEVVAAAADGGHHQGEEKEEEEEEEEEECEEEEGQDPNNLTFDEWQLAETFRSIFSTMAEDEDGLDMTSVSDYMFAQMAIIFLESSNPHADAVRSALQLQEFREKYGIRDTLAEGFAAFQDLVEVMPGAFLDFGFHPDENDNNTSGGEGRYCLVIDFSKCSVGDLGRSERKLNKWMVGHYYLVQAMNCDFSTIRKGCMIVPDCGDVRLSMNTDFLIVKETIEQLIGVYPMAPAHRFYNVGTFFHTVFSVTRKIMPERIKNKYDFVKRSDAPLRDLFLTPTLEAANQRTVKALQDALKNRYQNERNFTL